MKDLSKYTNNYIDGLTRSWLNGDDDKAQSAMKRLLNDIGIDVENK